ncbi:hypothetical protein CAOG_02149 [Capsaspora owczarzaki ATCC 30864]|uniref:Heparinase II/III-like C-terminal domain-containing protein n=1 Tax=Capsaspora owczarzaki (strain ATCC 30864) TaxID=595528 RepID=A0A0D2X1J5_CAPO3|nr:hypothetical protein CAOG_02149 [Capsaspora owczarzaki ATCC 30864]KJE90919.1 hypothetical protein, variant [Capsaspora owczarzaki ATCC 30864]|eukprot:XP_004348899.2 hypothetical protein CAOG_02149 [Capsaspora owczarzaki ATCC 30864]
MAIRLRSCLRRTRRDIFLAALVLGLLYLASTRTHGWPSVDHRRDSSAYAAIESHADTRVHQTLSAATSRSEIASTPTSLSNATTVCTHFVFRPSDPSTTKAAIDCFRARPIRVVRLFATDPQTTTLLSHKTARGFEMNLNRHRINITFPVDWHMNPFKDRSWRMWLHSLKDMIGPSLRAYEMHPENPSYLLLAKAFAMDWCGKFGHTRPTRWASLPPPWVGTAAFATREYIWYDMAVSSRAVLLMGLLHFGAHAGPEIMSEHEFAELATCQREQALFLAAQDTYFWTNHGLFADTALFLVSQSMPWIHPDGSNWTDVAAVRFAKNVGNLIDTASGVHKEHSVSYQGAMINLIALTDQLGLLNRTALGSDILVRMRQALGWMLTPDDAQPVPFVGDTSLEEFLNVAKPQHEDGLAPQSFPPVGLAIVKQLSTQSHLFMTAWFYSCTHKHADELSFVLTEFGRQLIVDPGKFAHVNTDPNRMYALSPQAHNGVTVDKSPYTACREFGKPYGSAIRLATTHDGFTIFAGDNPLLATHQRVHHTRILVYKPSKLLVVIDHLEPNDTETMHSYTRRFHYAENVALVKDANTSKSYNAYFGPKGDGADPELAAKVEDWSRTANQTRLSLVKARVKPALQGWIYPLLRKRVPAYVSEQTTPARGSIILVTAMKIARPAGLDRSPDPLPSAKLLKPVTWQRNIIGTPFYNIELQLDGIPFRMKVKP